MLLRLSALRPNTLNEEWCQPESLSILPVPIHFPFIFPLSLQKDSNEVQVDMRAHRPLPRKCHWWSSCFQQSFQYCIHQLHNLVVTNKFVEIYMTHFIKISIFCLREYKRSFTNVSIASHSYPKLICACSRKLDLLETSSRIGMSRFVLRMGQKTLTSKPLLQENATTVETGWKRAL